MILSNRMNIGILIVIFIMALVILTSGIITKNIDLFIVGAIGMAFTTIAYVFTKPLYSEEPIQRQNDTNQLPRVYY